MGQTESDIVFYLHITMEALTINAHKTKSFLLQIFHTKLKLWIILGILTDKIQIFPVSHS